MCENNAIDVAGTGKYRRKLKADYIQALLRSRGIENNVGEGDRGGNRVKSPGGLESQQAPSSPNQVEWGAGMASLSALLPTRAPSLIFGVDSLDGEGQSLHIPPEAIAAQESSRLENETFMPMEEDEEHSEAARHETDAFMPMEEDETMNATYSPIEDVEMTPVRRRSPKMIGVHLLDTPKSWHSAKEIRFACDENGSVDLDKLAAELGSPDRAIQAVTPKKPGVYYRYSNILDPREMEDLLHNNTLRVTFCKSKKV
ncbi:hypothetical protein H1R20_g820, partial [Candolleomyces eurysporus]